VAGQQGLGRARPPKIDDVEAVESERLEAVVIVVRGGVVRSRVFDNEPSAAGRQKGVPKTLELDEVSGGEGPGGGLRGNHG
jgi:hypothetical protein